MDEFYIFLIILVGCLFFIWFLDVFFMSCALYPYIELKRRSGLEIRLLRVHWFTTSFNRQVHKWSAFRPRLQTAWFTAGTWVSLAIMPFALFVILHSSFLAIRHLFSKSIDSLGSFEEVPVFSAQPMVPGLNMPTSDYGYYIISLFLSSVIHEMGHAMAAIREDGHLAGFSFSLLLLVPVARTHLEQIDQLAPTKQLRVFCAGVWNNVFLALVTALIATMVPWLFYPFYDSGSGVQIELIKPGSGLDGDHGLVPGDRVREVSGCTVLGTYSWHLCLAKILERRESFCLPDSFIKDHDESVPAKHIPGGGIDCCEANSPSHLCFEYLGIEEDPLPIHQHSCLNARKVVDSSRGVCSEIDPCLHPLLCFKPSLGNQTKLIQIKRAQGKTVLFIGHPSTVYHALQVTDFINLYPFLPSSIPDIITKLCQYIAIFSSGLAILNIIPCYHFDGQFIFSKMMDVFFEKRIPVATVRYAIALSVTTLGTLFMCVYVILMILTAV